MKTYIGKQPKDQESGNEALDGEVISIPPFSYCVNDKDI